MAEKTLNARFQLKYDKLADWQKTDTPNQGANLVLKKGEIAFCEIPSNAAYMRFVLNYTNLDNIKIYAE